jgi:hypothetical protein
MNANHLVSQNYSIMKRFLSLLSILSVSILLSACSKDEGCTNPEASNYDNEAIEDNGSCKFEGEMVFWFNQETSAELITEGTETLYFFLDDQEVGEAPTSLFWDEAPNCGAAGSLSVSGDLGSGTSRNFTYRVLDEDGEERWTGIVAFSVNSCSTVQLSL